MTTANELQRRVFLVQENGFVVFSDRETQVVFETVELFREAQKAIKFSESTLSDVEIEELLFALPLGVIQMSYENDKLTYTNDDTGTFPGASWYGEVPNAELEEFIDDISLYDAYELKQETPLHQAADLAEAKQILKALWKREVNSFVFKKPELAVDLRTLKLSYIRYDSELKFNLVQMQIEELRSALTTIIDVVNGTASGPIDPSIVTSSLSPLLVWFNRIQQEYLSIKAVISGLSSMEDCETFFNTYIKDSVYLEGMFGVYGTDTPDPDFYMGGSV